MSRDEALEWIAGLFEEPVENIQPDLDALEPDALAAAGCFHPPAVTQLVAKIRAGTSVSETDEMALAGIESTQLWHELFVCRFSMPRPVSKEDDVKVCRGGLGFI